MWQFTEFTRQANSSSREKFRETVKPLWPQTYCFNKK